MLIPVQYGRGDVRGFIRLQSAVGLKPISPAASRGCGSSPTDAGRAYVFNGETGVLIDCLVSPNEQPFGYFGTVVAWAGDLDDDGYDDVVVGAPGENDAGRAYVFLGEEGDTPASDGAASEPFTLPLDGPFPNPSDGTVLLSIRLPAGRPGEASLGLYDAAGRCVHVVFSAAARSGQNLSWSAPCGLAPGIY